MTTKEQSDGDYWCERYHEMVVLINEVMDRLESINVFTKNPQSAMALAAEDIHKILEAKQGIGDGKWERKTKK